jgi:hypothetical protein
MTCATRCLTGLFGIIGNLRPVRHIFFFEGCVFVCAAIPVAPHFGIVGVLLTSLITHALITGLLSVRAVTKTNLPMTPIFQVFFFSLVVFGVASVLRSILISDSSPFFQAFAQALLLVLVAVFFGFFLILPKSLWRTLREKSCTLKIS